MGWETDVNDHLNDHSNDHSVADVLAERIGECVARLSRIDVMRRAGRGGYKRVSSLRVTDDDDEEKPDAKDGARKCIELADAHAERHGDARYQFVGLEETTKVKSGERSLFRVAYVIGSAGENPRTEEFVAHGEMFRKQNDDLHKRNMACYDKLEVLSDKIVDMAKGATQNSEHLVEMFKMQNEAYRERYAHDENMASSAAAWGLAETAVTVVGPGLITMLGQLFQQRTGIDPNTVTGPIPDRVKAWIASLGPEELEKVKAHFGDDVWDVLEAAAKAEDNDTGVAILRKLSELWGAQGASQVREKFFHLAQMIGEAKTTVLIHLLVSAGVNVGVVT